MKTSPHYRLGQNNFFFLLLRKKKQLFIRIVQMHDYMIICFSQANSKDLRFLRCKCEVTVLWPWLIVLMLVVVFPLAFGENLYYSFLTSLDISLLKTLANVKEYIEAISKLLPTFTTFFVSLLLPTNTPTTGMRRQLCYYYYFETRLLSIILLESVLSRHCRTV